MKVETGNIFEVYRLVLPEHRALMEQYKKSKIVHYRPMFSEDSLQELQLTLESAIQREARVAVSVFNNHENKIVKGIPTVKGTRLCITGTESREYIDLNDVFSIELI